MVRLTTLQSDEVFALRSSGSEIGALAVSVSYAWSMLVGTLPVEKLLQLCKAGRISPAGLPPEAWSQLGPEAMSEMIAQKRIVIDDLPRESFEHLPAELMLDLWQGQTYPARISCAA